MQTAPMLGSLELREARGGAVRFTGRFPYNVTAVLSDGGRNGGRPRKEKFAPRAFSFAVEDQSRDIMFLSGHRYDKPLASRKAGTLTLEDTEQFLIMRALLTSEILETTWARDFMAGYNAGLIFGLSPGFRVPPQETVPDAEEVEEEDPSEGRALIRTIKHAILFEVSAVTKPAYEEAALEEERSWTPTPRRQTKGGLLL